jgi:integrase
LRGHFVANLTASLVRVCKTPLGWRRYPAVIGKNGRVRPGFVKVGDQIVEYPVGRYEVRKYIGKKLVYVPAGEHAGDSLEILQNETRLMAAKDILADVSGIQLVEQPERFVLSKQLRLFLDATLDRGSTVAARTYRLASEEFLKVIERTYVDQVTADDILKFHKALHKRGISDRTIHNRHMNAMAFLRFCGLDIKKLAPRAPRYEKTMPEIFEDEALKAFFASLKNPYQRLVFELLLKTGMREQEAMYVEWTDISTTARTLQLRAKPKYKFKIKDHEQRAMPLTDELMELLSAYRRSHPSGDLILGTKNKRPPTKLLRLLKGCAKRAGLNCGTCNACVERKECDQWFLHKFRATYCTKLLRSGLDLRTVQQMMGHADLASTMRYLRPAENAETQIKVNSINWH